MKFDQSQDRSGRELFAFVDGTELPDFVKEANFDDAADAKWFDKEGFADQIGGNFPLHSPARVYVSNVYFRNKQAELKQHWGPAYVQKVGEAIETAASVFGIKEHLDSYNSQFNVKHASVDDTRVVSSIEFEGETYGLFPVKTAQDLKDSMHVFASEIHKFPFDTRKKIAGDFLTAASDFQVHEVPDLLAKYGGLYLPDTVQLVNVLSHRSTKIASPVLAEKYKQLVAQAEKVASLSEIDTLLSNAAAIEKEAGLHMNIKVASEIGDLVDRVYSLSLDKVAEILDCIEMAGDFYKLAELTAISPEIYKEAFGCDIDPSNRSVLRDVLPTMPASDVSLFRELSGVTPLA